MLKNASLLLQENRKKLNIQYSQKAFTSYLDDNALLLDEYFREGFENSIAGPELNHNGISYAVIALGGYGRAEQCVFSDVDIMFLFDKKIPKEAEDLIKEMIYPLWDIGLDIGHATRTVDECIQLANQDIEILTSLLDGRFLCGLSPLFHQLRDNLNSKTRSNQKKFINWIKTSSMERHQLFGDSSNLLEPDLKNGMGGLRDYHAMLWVGKIKALINQPDDLTINGFLSKNEYDNLKDALDFIWKVRNTLHIVAERKCDQLYFEYHDAVAKKLNFQVKNGQKPVESFIGELHEKMELVKQHHLIFLSETGHTKKFFINKNMFKKSKTPGILISKSMLDFASLKSIEKKPELLLQIFLESARLKFPLCSSAKRMISDAAPLIEKIKNNPAVVEIFEKTMLTATKEFNVFNEMLNTGFLKNFIPEFDKITNRIQYNQYHIYPVDRHSIHVLQEVRDFAKKEKIEQSPLYGELYTEIKNKKVLHWAALLHDIGKGDPENEHSFSGAKLAEKILEQKGVNKKYIEEVSFLIEQHLFLINIAKRRDIEDEETAVFCARKIQSVNKLKMLYLLTIADSISTGPNAWNDWTEGLLRELFFKVLEILNAENFASAKKEKALEKKRKKIIDLESDFSFEKGFLKKVISGMSHRYLLNNSEENILAHIKLLENMKNNSTGFDLSIRKDPKTGNRIATLCGNATPGFFSKIAGIFTLNNYDILDAQIYSWGKTTALDIFTIQPFYEDPHEDLKSDKIKIDIEKAINDQIDLNTELQSKSPSPAFKKKGHIEKADNRIEFDNNSSSFFTIIEIYTYDYPGILFAVTNALHKNNLNIVYAKIATHVDQVVDIFYVKELYGGKIYAKESIENIKESIFAELGM